MGSLALNQLSEHQSEDEINNLTDYHKNGEYYSKDDDNKFIKGSDDNSVQNKHITDFCVNSKTEDNQFTCYLPSNENMKTRSESSTELKSLMDDVDNILKHYPHVSLLTEVDNGIDVEEVGVGLYITAGEEVHYNQVHDYVDLND